MLIPPEKDALRALLESQVREKLQHNPDAVTTYAAQPEPDRKRYISKPTVQDQAFAKELDKMRANAEAGNIYKRESAQLNDVEASISLDDYPGLKAAGTPSTHW